MEKLEWIEPEVQDLMVKETKATHCWGPYPDGVFVGDEDHEHYS